jgi:amino acid adenylation domain-containing protein
LETEALIGFFVNTLVLRVEVEGRESFRELVRREREAALGAYGHQEVPFEKLVEELRPERDMSHTPLFQVMFVLQNSEMPVVELAGLKLTPLEIPTTTVNFDLALAMEESEQGMFVAMHYNTDLFDAPTIARMLRHFQILLEGIAADPDRRLSSLPLLDADERRQVLGEWNDTKKDYAAAKRLHELFEAQAARTPDASALTFADEGLTYAELNRRANQLARYLRQLGVGADVPVGVCLERSLEMVVGLLGILKAGGAYVPLDPDYPVERLAFMLEDVRAPVVLTQSRLAHVLPEHGARVVQLDSEREAIAQQETDNLNVEVWEESLAYVIYTSGSTGRPKGAMNTHRGICNRLLWMQDEYGLSASDSVLQKTPYSFDVSVWEFFWPLITGARLVGARPGGHQDSGYLVRLVAEQRITTLHFVPSMLQVFLEEQDLESCDALTRVICSGEALSPQLQERFFARLGAGLYNLYGPTEAAVDVTHWTCVRGGARHRSVPIGRPIANTEIYILDAHLQPAPAGVPGELYIGGAGLARGYLNRPDLTAERFVANPFGDAGTRLYRTGDRALFRSGGEIEYLGRTDYQVKIRGFRIELGEIEAALGAHAAVREAVVLAREDSPGDKRLVAYVVAETSATSVAGSVDGLKSFLRERLPEYMIPSAFVSLEQFPLTPNGKIDRRALPAPEKGRAGVAAAQPYVAPRTPIEQELADIWAELLQIEKVGIYDNFFELGGHSLLLTQLASRIRKNLQVELPLRVLFDVPTVVEMTTAIAEMQVGQEDSEEMARMLDELKQLSPEEVRALLEAEG